MMDGIPQLLIIYIEDGRKKLSIAIVQSFTAFKQIMTITGSSACANPAAWLSLYQWLQRTGRGWRVRILTRP